MKIALLCDRYPPRQHTGIGTFTQMMARGLRQRGHTVTVVEIGDRYSESSDQGIPVFTLPRSHRRWAGNLITRLRLRRWLNTRIRARAIELVEVPDYPGFLPFSLPGCATVVRLHQSSTVSHRLAGLKMSPGIHFYEKRTLAANPNWISVSSHILGLTQEAFGVSPQNFAVIHNGIEPLPPAGAELPSLPARFVLYAGQVSRRKGSIVLGEAARDFLPRHPGVHLVYAGGCLPEPGVPAIDQEIRTLVGSELAIRIHFFGQLTREQTLACMRRAAVFAFPALIDCFPLVVLEAMSAGVPVVFTRNPPGPEMIEDGVSGLLADPASARDFAQKISHILDDPEFAALLAAMARKRVAERFSLERCLQATEQFYEECLRQFR
ncbi:MAG TPA: glycosyltransferase family 4 protein [Terriglobales bacterium]|nr:glycosyltransferase family 4 protein [Terriglobales bacterium]